MSASSNGENLTHNGLPDFVNEALKNQGDVKSAQLKRQMGIDAIWASLQHLQNIVFDEHARDITHANKGAWDAVIQILKSDKTTIHQPDQYCSEAAVARDFLSPHIHDEVNGSQLKIRVQANITGTNALDDPYKTLLSEALEGKTNRYTLNKALGKLGLETSWTKKAEPHIWRPTLINVLTDNATSVKASLLTPGNGNEWEEIYGTNARLDRSSILRPNQVKWGSRYKFFKNIYHTRWHLLGNDTVRDFIEAATGNQLDTDQADSYQIPVEQIKAFMRTHLQVDHSSLPATTDQAEKLVGYAHQARKWDATLRAE